MTAGNVAVECSTSGVFFRGFPFVSPVSVLPTSAPVMLAMRPIPSLMQQWRQGLALQYIAREWCVSKGTAWTRWGHKAAIMGTGSCVNPMMVSEQVSRIEGPWPAAEAMNRTYARQWPLSSLRRPSILPAPADDPGASDSKASRFRRALTSANVAMHLGRASRGADSKGPRATRSLDSTHPEQVSSRKEPTRKVRSQLSAKQFQALNAACLASL